MKLLDDAVDAILITENSKRKYLSLAHNVNTTYRAILPDPTASAFAPIRTLFSVIAEKIRSLTPEVDVSGVMEAVEELLDRSIATEGYVIETAEPPVVDLSKIDFEALKARFEKSHKRIEAEKLKGAIGIQLTRMIRLNRSRLDYLEKFQQMIEEYNAGSLNVETFFAKLVAFAEELTQEEKRGIAERLSEEELAVFDLLTRPEMRLTKVEERQVKQVAEDLLNTLKREKLVLDWRKRQQSRAAVRLCIQEILDQLPAAYTRDLYGQKCELVYQHVYDSYFGEGASVYAAAS